MAYQVLVYEVAERVATITLNRPEQMNVLSSMQPEATTADGRNLDDIRKEHGMKAFLEARDAPYRH